MKPKLITLGPVLDGETGRFYQEGRRSCKLTPTPPSFTHPHFFISGKLVPRSVEFILPTKTIKAFNEKNLKWGNKVVKYKDSGWVFVRAIMDEELMDEISGMIYFQKWQNTIIHKFDFLTVSAPDTNTDIYLYTRGAWDPSKSGGCI